MLWLHHLEVEVLLLNFLMWTQFIAMTHNLMASGLQRVTPLSSYWKKKKHLFQQTEGHIDKEIRSEDHVGLHSASSPHHYNPLIQILATCTGSRLVQYIIHVHSWFCNHSLHSTITGYPCKGQQTGTRLNVPHVNAESDLVETSNGSAQLFLIIHANWPKENMSLQHLVLYRNKNSL